MREPPFFTDRERAVLVWNGSHSVINDAGALMLKVGQALSPANRPKAGISFREMLRFSTVNYSHRSPKGNRYLRRLWMQVAWGAIQTKKTFYASLFQRLKPRIEAKGAAWAVAHRMSQAIWLILHKEVEYQERGQAAPNPRTQAPKFRKLVREFTSQGIDVRDLLEKTLEARA